MQCPICLSYSVDTEAVVVVRGTQYCGPHGVEALATPERPMANRRFMSFFTPPPGAVMPTPPASPAEP